MDMKEIRNRTGLSRAKFAERYDIPLRTVEDWEFGKRKPPAYVLKLLERAVYEDMQSVFSDSENFELVKRLELGDGFAAETYRSANYEVSITRSGGSASLTATPLTTWLPEIHIAGGEVTRIGFTGDVILEADLEKHADGLRRARDIIESLKKL